MSDSLLTTDDRLLASVLHDLRDTRELLSAALDLAARLMRESRATERRYERLLEDFREMQ